MLETIAEHLQALYGPQCVPGLLHRIADLIDRSRPLIPKPVAGVKRARLTADDVILITYADQVQEPSTAPLSSLAAFLERHVRGVVSSVHFLPFYPSSSDDGFSVIDYQRVDPSIGDWPDMTRMGQSFALMFDAVFNHASAQSEWFLGFLADDPRYRDFFVTVEGEPDLSAVIRPRALPLLTEFRRGRTSVRVWTTFSADQVDLNFANPEVLLAVLEVLLFYVIRGARFIRLDAIAFLWKEPGTTCLHLPRTHRTVQLLRAVLDRIAAKVVLITETNVPHADNVSYLGNGTNEAQLVYNFALPPLVLHSFIRGEANKLTAWAQSLQLPSPEAALFNFLASHDGIGINPVRGLLDEQEIQRIEERVVAHGGLISYKSLPDGSRATYELNINYFDALSDPAGQEPLTVQIARFLCAQAIMLAFPGVPGIYFHSLFGSRGNPQAAAATGIPRRINREKFRREQIERQLTDPGSRESQVFGGLKTLLRARHSQRAFHPGGKFQVLAWHSQVFGLLRTGIEDGADVLCLHNVSHEAVDVPLPVRNEFPSLEWCSILPERFVSAPPRGAASLRLPGYGIFWARAQAGSTSP